MYCKSLTGNAFNEIDNLKSLGVLKLCFCESLNTEGTNRKLNLQLICYLALSKIGLATSLKILDISKCPLIDDDSLKHLKTLTNLETLVLTKCILITSDGVSDLVNHITDLQIIRNN